MAGYGVEMALKHPKGPSAPRHDLTPPPMFDLQDGVIPRHELPAGELSRKGPTSSYTMN
jgi:hypothetical protein